MLKNYERRGLQSNWRRRVTTYDTERREKNNENGRIKKWALKSDKTLNPWNFQRIPAVFRSGDDRLTSFRYRLPGTETATGNR